jgi:LmbE family N-acetylglucosaminyl deacetylase
MKLLVIGGHPADVFDHCGGTLARHADRGDTVTAVALTQGLRVHDVVISEQLRFMDKKPDAGAMERLVREREEVKRAEVRAACAKLGVNDVRFIRYDDKFLLVTAEMVEGVARLVRELRPDVVITHYPLENAGVAAHHGVAGQIVLHAIGYAGMADFDDPHPAHRTPQVFFMAPLEATFKPTVLSGVTPVYCDYYVDITDVVHRKVAALAGMASQQYGGEYAKKVIECWNGKDGHFLTLGYAEGFVRYLPEIGDFLDVSTRRMAWANEEELATRRRSSVFTVPHLQL